MNLILLSADDFTGPDQVLLQKRRFKHLVTVNRAAVGDELTVGRLNGKIGRATVTQVKKDQIQLEILNLDQDPPSPLPLTLILALPRPKMLKRIIETVSCLGVKRIFLTNSWRVERSYWQSPVLEEAKIKSHIIAGLEQGKDTMIPEIRTCRYFSSLIKDVLPTLPDSRFKIVAHPKGQFPCPAELNQPLILAIGPEGGFIDREIDSFAEHGFDVCHLGPRILRVETAVPYLIARLFTHFSI